MWADNIRAVRQSGPAYRENATHTISGVPPNHDNYWFELKYYTTGDSEAVDFQMYDYSSGTWDHVADLQSPTPIEYSKVLTDSNYLSGTGEVQVRYLQQENDKSQTSLMIDYCQVRAENVDHRLGWEHRIVGLPTDYDNYEVRVYGHADSGENFGVWVWNDSSSSWEFIDNLDTTDKWIEATVDNTYLNGENISIKYDDWTDGGDSPENIYIDYCTVHAEAYYYSTRAVHDSERVTLNQEYTDNVEVTLKFKSLENSATYYIELYDWVEDTWEHTQSVTNDGTTEETVTVVADTDGANYISNVTGRENIRVRIRTTEKGAHRLREDFLEYKVIDSVQTAPLRWEYRFENVGAGFDNYRVNIYGYADSGEDFNIYAWDNASDSWVYSGRDLPVEPARVRFTVPESYFSGDNLSIKIEDSDTEDVSPDNIHIDYCNLEQISKLTWLKVKVKSGTDNDPYLNGSYDSENWSSWNRIYPGTNLPHENRYLQYRVELMTTEDLMSPQARSVV